MFTDKAKRALHLYYAEAAHEDTSEAAEPVELSPSAIVAHPYSYKTGHLDFNHNHAPLPDRFRQPVAHYPTTYAPVTTYEVSPPRNNARVWYWALSILLLIALVLAAFIPIEHRLSLPHVTITSGQPVTITAETEGLVKQTYVKPGTYVIHGQPLIRLSNPEPTSSGAFSNQLIALTAQEEELQARLVQIDTQPDAQHDEPHKHTHLSNSTISYNREYLETTLLTPLQQSLTQTEETLKTHQATKRQLQTKWKTNQRRLNEAKAMKQQGVVYDSGNYIEPLITNLQENQTNLNRQLKTQQTEIDKAQKHLTDIREQLNDARLQARERLVKALADTQQAISNIHVKIAASKGQPESTLIRSPVNGLVENLQLPRPGTLILAGDTLVTLRKHTDKGHMMINLPAIEGRHIRVGESASISILHPLESRWMEFTGRIKSHTYPAIQQSINNTRHHLQLEIDIPPSTPAHQTPFLGEFTGAADIAFESRHLWQYLFNW